jgi:hypothetical protein
MRSITTLVIVPAVLSATPAAADMRPTPEAALFCPSWAEAHERSLASLNHGRPPYGVRWKGCIVIKKGEQVDLVEVEKISGSNEVIYKGKHWFTDGGPFE